MLKLLGVATAMGLVFGLSAGTFSRPLAKEPGVIYFAADKSQTLQIIDNNKVRFDFDRGKSKHVNFKFMQPVPLLPAVSAMDFFVDIELPDNSSVRKIRLCVIDRNKKEHQLTTSVDPAKSKQRISWKITNRDENNREWAYPLAVNGLIVDYTHKPEARDFLNIGVYGFKALPDSQKVDVSETLAAPLISEIRGADIDDLALFIAGGSQSGIIVLCNRSAKAISGNFELTMFGPETVMWSKRVPCTIAPGGEYSIPVNVPEKFGRYLLQVKYPGGMLEQRFALLDPAGSRKAGPGIFRFGVNTHLTRIMTSEQRELEVRAASLAGTQTIRGGGGMGAIWPAKDRHHFTRCDEMTRLFKKYSIEWDLLCSGAPRWATRKGWKPVVLPATRGDSCPDYALWSEYVALVLRRYGDVIGRVEIWNEPELPGFANFTPEEYVELLKHAYRTVKKINPKMTVTSAGYACLPGAHPKMTDPDFMPKTLVAGRGFYDVFAFHGHGNYSSYVTTLDGLEKLRRKLNIDKLPWYANETAVSAIGIGELAQARTLFKKVIFSQARGAEGYLWYDLRNDGFDPKNNEHNFGLLTHDFQPKLAYCAYNTIGKHFYGAKFTGDVAGSQMLEGYRFKRDGRHILAFWTRANSRGGVFAVLGKKEIEEFDLWGNRTVRKPNRDGVILFSAVEQPKFIICDEAISEPIVLAELTDMIRINTRSEGRLLLALSNPTDSTLALSASVSGGKEKSVTLAPKEAKTVECSFQSKDSPYVRISIPGSTAQWPFTVRQTQELRPFAVRKTPDFVLNRASQLYPTAPNDPMYVDCFWRGPEDLSANVIMGTDGDLLRIRTVVLDDVHHPEPRVRDLFTGDSVQLAFAVPGSAPFWEFGISEKGKFCYQSPKDADGAKVLALMNCHVMRDEAKKQTIYDISIPLTALKLKTGKTFRFNLLVNDNDGLLREGFLTLAPGLGESKTSEFFLPVMLKK